MSQKKLIKIALVSTSPIFRTGLRKLLSHNFSFTVVSETIDIATLTNIEREKPDVLLLDWEIDEMKFFHNLVRIPETLKIIILTDSDNVQISEKFFEFGVRGIVSKENGAAILSKAVKKVCDGEFWFERSAMAAVILSLIKEKRAFYADPELYKITSLTEREKEVVFLVGQGLKNKEIAERLFISENTVRHHLGSIFEKLNVAGRLELVIYAFKHNLVKFD